MISKTEGIVLQLVKYRDSSAICKVYTRDHGLVSVIANNVRSSKKGGSKAALLQPLSILELVIYHNEKRGIQRLSDFRPLHLHLDLSSNFLKNLVGTFLLELLNRCLGESESNPALFEFIKTQLIRLDQERFHPDFHLWFLARFTAYLGIQPHNNYSSEACFFALEEGSFVKDEKNVTNCVSPPFSEYISALLRMDNTGLTQMRLTREERKHLLTLWMQYYQLHLEQFGQLKSLKVMEALLEDV